MNVSFKLKVPMMPDTISYETPPGKRQDGFKPGSNEIKVKDLTEEQAKEYAEELKGAFIDHWKNLRGN